MKKPQDNYAFIDGNNLHLSIIDMGWRLDYRKFRVHLSETYGVCKAYYCIGRMPQHESLYAFLKSSGYELKFKPVLPDKDGKPKGNCDAELVLQAMIDLPNYRKAVIVSSDGDFACLVEHLSTQGKLERVIASSRGACSALLRRAAGTRLDYMDNLRVKLEFIEQSKQK